MGATFTFSTMAPGLGKRPARRAFGLSARGFAFAAGAAVIAATIAAAALFDRPSGAARVPGAAGAPAATSVAGVFTGAYLDGVPLYRLPPVAVVAKRGHAKPLPRGAPPRNDLAAVPRVSPYR
jgi:hypothetical protein